MKNRIASFGYAFNGLKVAFQEEPNFRIHIFALLVVLLTGLYVQLDAADWMIIVLTVVIVMITELLNTAIENICDFVHEERHPAIGRIKDICAAAVFISAIGAMVVAGLIFYPYVI